MIIVIMIIDKNRHIIIIVVVMVNVIITIIITIITIRDIINMPIVIITIIIISFTLLSVNLNHLIKKASSLSYMASKRKKIDKDYKGLYLYFLIVLNHFHNLFIVCKAHTPNIIVTFNFSQVVYLIVSRVCLPVQSCLFCFKR